MLNNGDKLVVTKTVAPFLKEGDVVKVTNVTDDGIISFAFGDNFMHMGVMNNAELEAHFKKMEEVAETPTITEEYIEEIMENSEFDVRTVFDKCTVVTCRLPSGFVISDYAACVDPKNYDENMGVEICHERIKNKIWELEAYRLQQFLWEESMSEETDCHCENCDGCDDYNEDEDVDYDCVDDDFVDCDNCEEYDCPFNTNC